MYKQGELLLIPVPFSDLSAKKRRPVVVISNDAYNAQFDDILVAAVTSNVRKRPYTIFLNQEHMETGQIPKPSCIRADKLYSLSSDIVQKSVGKITSAHFQVLYLEITKLIQQGGRGK